MAPWSFAWRQTVKSIQFLCNLRPTVSLKALATVSKYPNPPDPSDPKALLNGLSVKPPAPVSLSCERSTTMGLTEAAQNLVV